MVGKSRRTMIVMTNLAIVLVVVEKEEAEVRVARGVLVVESNARLTI